MSGTSGLCFGGGSHVSGPPPIVSVDYVTWGCAAVSAAYASNLTLQNLALDMVRLPFTVGRVTANDKGGMTVALQLETEAGRDVYLWNETKYPWLTTVMDNASAAVPLGERATRELKKINLQGFSSTR